MPDELRTNDEWIAALSHDSAASAAAVGDLQALLRRALLRVVRSCQGIDIDDLVQDSLARIVENLHSFRGESRFTTWAASIAVRVAFTEIRRQSARATRTFDQVEDEALELSRQTWETPEIASERKSLFGTLEEAIALRLTDRQRIAILAELRGVPTIEIADRLGTNQNALYKLVHDARRTLQRALSDAGFSSEVVRDTLMEMRR